MGASQIYLLGFILLFNGVFSMPSPILSEDVAVEHAPDYLVATPDLIRSKNLAQERATSNSKYPELYSVNVLQQNGYTGFRGVFQWAVGESVNNTGLQNSMGFTVKDSMNTQFLGDIGIYTNGSQIVFQLLLDTVSVSGSSFNFSIYSNISLISNAIYFLDVEINQNKLTGYLSAPQTNLSAISNPNLPRSQIGEINWLVNLSNLTPTSYTISNSYKSCNSVSDITTFNYPPELYNNKKREKGIFINAVTYVARLCGPLNTLTMTDWSTVVFISRPTPVFNETFAITF